MRTPPFYSLFRGIAVEDVWHDNNDCQIGQSIAIQDRLPGHNDRKHCPYCQIHNTPRDTSLTRRW
ncbi:MAG: hypothetical protein EOO60_01855 [Hymenobacter sp.]|nr:MAG: hypothetical protein EOO60_01855 [Hymenobacter sp.]